MKWVLLYVAVAGVVVESGLTKGPKGQMSYHRSIGIPMAGRLKELELAANSTRIIGGTSVPAGTHPFMVGIVITLNSPFTSMCGASFLTNSRSLTAAHCWFDAWDHALGYTMVFGSPTLHFGGVRIYTTDIETHPNYNTGNFNNDIAIVRHDSVTFNNNISPIQLPIGQPNIDFDGTWAVAVGYGLNEYGSSPNPDKREVSLQVVSNALCSEEFGANFVVPSTLCTSAPMGFNTCQGDSGGPLFVGPGHNRFLIGVTSFGSFWCEDGKPSAFARVTSFLSWILSRP